MLEYRVRKMRNRKIVSMRDIARATGVSMTTVSRVMSNQGNLSQETRDRIMKTARELGYYDNRLSSAIRLGRTGTVGVLIDLSVSYYNRLFRGIAGALDERDCLPVVAYRENEDCAMLHRMIEQRVDGIIIVPTQDDSDNQFYCEVMACGIPMIAVDREVPADIDFVGTDDYEGGRCVAEYLYRKGHRRIGYYAGPQLASPARLRFQGFRNFCLEHPEVSMIQIGEGNWPCMPYEEMIPFLEEHTEITAIACHTDYYARQILSAAKLAGISSIPVVCGFGNITSEFPDTIPIPTVEQHPEQQGRFAVERLFLRMKHPELVPEKFRFPPELLEKSTVMRGMKQRIILK